THMYHHTSARDTNTFHNMDNASDRGVVHPPFTTDRAYGRLPLRDTNAEADRMPICAPADNKRLNRRLHVDRKPKTARRGILARDRGIDEHHYSVAVKAGKGGSMTRDDRSERL